VLRLRRLVTGFGSVVLAGFSLCGCATTRTKLESADAAVATYRIECIRLGDCWAEAQRACRGDYRMLERHDNAIPESELPGLNARTESHSHRRWELDTFATRSAEPYGPGIESDGPMPLTDVVVACSAAR
jgi:hypothetical protein